MTTVFEYDDWVDFIYKKFNYKKNSYEEISFFIRNRPHYFQNMLGKIFIKQIILSSSFKIKRNIITICDLQRQNYHL